MVYAKSNYATIEDSTDFVVCKYVKKFMPEKINNSFSPGGVYVWALVKAPKNEKINLEWLFGGSKIYQTSISVIRDLNGYRVYFFQTLLDTGNYEVRLYNSNNDLIGIKEFKIEKVTRQIKK